MSLRDTFSNVVDRTIELFSPQKAVERKAARTINEQFSQYKGAQSNRLNSSWSVSSGSADYDLLPDLPVLRERSRELLRNDPHAASLVNTMVDNIVGTGIRPQAQIDAEALGLSEEEAAKLAKACEKAFSKWMQYADVGRRMNFYDIQSQAMRSIIVNGESLILPVRVERKFSPYDLAIEVIEPDRIEAPGEMDQVNGRFKRLSGIELGKNGYPHAVWVKVSHPGDGIFERSSDNRYRKILFTNADGDLQVLHLMNQNRPGQTRGEPMMASAMQAFKDLSSYTEAVITKERVAACHTLFISKQDAYSSALNRSDEILNKQRIEEISPGQINYLQPGEEVSFGNPPANNSATYDAFVTRNLRTIGASLGLPYELISKDFSQTNYSSARAALLESRRVFGKWQQYLINHLCSPIYEMVIEEAWLRGEIPIKDFDSNRYELTRSRWIPPSYGWIDPLKEIKAAQLAIETGLSSLSIEAAAQGRDWESIVEQRAREEALRQELTGEPNEE